MSSWQPLQQPRLRVQTSPTLPPSDAGWTTQPALEFEQGDEAALPALGSATLFAPFGALRAQLGSRFEHIRRPDLVGQLIRLLVKDPTGAVAMDDGVYRAFWHGQITAITWSPDGGADLNAGGAARLNCAGILSLADQVTLTEGHLAGPTSTDPPIPLGFFPPLNDPAWGPTPLTQASSSLIPRAVKLFRRLYPDGLTGDLRWTALDFLDYLTAAFWPRAWGELAIGGDTSALLYRPAVERLQGLTLAQAIQQLIDPQRGITARPEVSGSTITLVVRTTSPTAIVMPGYTLPANTDTVTFSARGRPAGSTTVSDDGATRYGTIVARSERPWLAITGARPNTGSHMLIDGWNATEATAWGSNPRDGSAGRVYRRFAINPAWDGTLFGGGAGLRGTLTRETSDTYGTQGLTGARTSGGYGTTSGAVPADLVELTSDLPARLDGATLKARCFLIKSSTVRDVSDTWSINVENDPPAVIIDDGDHGRLLKAYRDAGYDLVVTVGMREVHPLTVSWVGDPTNPRTKVVEIPGFEQRIIPAGVRLRESGTESLTTHLDQIDELRSTVAMARGRFAGLDHGLWHTQYGVFDVRPNIGAPAQLVTTVDTGDDDGPRTLNLTILRRSWRSTQYGDVDAWETEYEIRRMVPESGVTL